MYMKIVKIMWISEYTPFTQLTLLTVRVTLELCLYRAAKFHNMGMACFDYNNL
jgi:hypothetical protein